MDALEARSTALKNHRLYQEVLEAIKAAVEASPPQFKCEVYIGDNTCSYYTAKALAAELRSDHYVVEYDTHTYMLTVSWYSLLSDP